MATSSGNDEIRMIRLAIEMPSDLGMWVFHKHSPVSVYRGDGVDANVDEKRERFAAATYKALWGRGFTANRITQRISLNDRCGMSAGN
jgi:hypothetical protein